MNKNKLTLISSIILTVLGAGLSIFTLILLIKSYYYENDGYGVSIELNADYIVYFISSIILLIFGIVTLKNKEYNTQYALVSAGVIELLLSFYPLGVFFKAISKGKPFAENYQYLIIGVIFTILLVLTIVYYFVSYRKKAKSNN